MCSIAGHKHTLLTTESINYKRLIVFIVQALVFKDPVSLIHCLFVLKPRGKTETEVKAGDNDGNGNERPCRGGWVGGGKYLMGENL